MYMANIMSSHVTPTTDVMFRDVHLGDTCLSFSESLGSLLMMRTRAAMAPPASTKAWPCGGCPSTVKAPTAAATLWGDSCLRVAFTASTIPTFFIVAWTSSRGTIKHSCKPMHVHDKLTSPHREHIGSFGLTLRWAPCGAQIHIHWGLAGNMQLTDISQDLAGRMQIKSEYHPRPAIELRPPRVHD
jgi:hypothetical protein